MIKKGEVPNRLKDKQIILINTASLIAGTKYRGEFEERVNNLIKEVINQKILSYLLMKFIILLKLEHQMVQSMQEIF